MATRKSSRKLAEEEEQPAEDEQEQQLDAAAEDEADELSDKAEDENLDPSRDHDFEDDFEEPEDEDEGAEDDAQLAEKSGGKSGKAGKAFPGAAKPFGKGGKRQPADDAEDEADGGADEDSEEMDDMTSDDEDYDEANAGDDEEEAPAPKSRGKGKGKGMPVKKMTEPQLMAENAKLREELTTLREEMFKVSVNRTLSEFTRDIRSESEDEEFALPRSFKQAYRDFMFSQGVKLSEESVSGLNEVVKLALKVGTIPMASLANQVERGRVVDADDRRPRVSGNDPDMTPEAERIALSEFKMPLARLAETKPEAVADIYFGLEEKRKGKRGSAA